MKSDSELTILSSMCLATCCNRRLSHHVWSLAMVLGLLLGRRNVAGGRAARILHCTIAFLVRLIEECGEEDDFIPHAAELGLNG